MREDLTFVNAVAGALRADMGLTVEAWEALPPSVRIPHYLVDAIILLGMAREELNAEHAIPLLGIRPDLDRAIELADRVLKTLDT
jgi:hypothetical protein